MKPTWLWIPVPIVILGYVFFQLASTQARLDAIAERIDRLEESPPSQDPIAFGRRAGRAPDGGTRAARGPGTAPQAPDLAAVKWELEQLKAEVREGGDDHRIIDVVERKQEEILSRHLDFHQERWVEARDDGLDNFATQARLSPIQRERLKTLMDQEVDEIMSLLRDPQIREDPERLASAWDETLNATDYEVRRFLIPSQRERWEEARAFERAVFFPWLPK